MRHGFGYRSSTGHSVALHRPYPQFPAVTITSAPVLDPVDLADGRTRQRTSPGFQPILDGLPVVLAVLGVRSSASLTATLQQAGASVRVVSNLSDARREIAPFGPCVTVVVDPPAVTGLIRAGLRVLSRQSAVLLLSVNATTRERIDFLHSGADSVLCTADPDEVVAAMAALLRRSRMPTAGPASQVVFAGEIRLHLLHRTATAASGTLDLTALEFDLLAYFVAHKGEALSRDRLLKKVWGYDFGGRETVTVHIRRLRKKIEADPSRPTLLQTVWGIGYRLNPDHKTEPGALRPQTRHTNSGAANEPLAATPEMASAPRSQHDHDRGQDGDERGE